MLEDIRRVLESKYPPELVQALLQSYLEIKHNYALDKYEASELNGGKFVEACVRILQFETDPSRHYTPLGSSIRNMIDTLRNFERTSANIHDSYRLHIPRVLNPRLSAKEKTLLILYVVFPDSRHVQALLKDIEYSNPSVFRGKVLSTLHKERLVEYNQEQDVCRILPPGIQYVEKRILPKEGLE